MEFGQDIVVTPLLFTRSVMGFLTTENQDLDLTSYPKGDACYSIVSPSLYWGVKTQAEHRVRTSYWPHKHLFQEHPSFPRRSPIQVLTRSTSRTHKHCNKTQGLNTETNKLNEITRGVVYMNTNEEWGNRTEPNAQRQGEYR